MIHTSEVDYDDTGLAAVTAPVPCVHVTIREKLGGIGIQYDVAAPGSGNTKFRKEAGEATTASATGGKGMWQAGEIVCYIQPVSGSGTVTFSKICE